MNSIVHRGIRFRLTAILLVGLCLVATSLTAYTVPEGASAVVTRFGKPVRVVTTSGLHWRWPAPLERAQIVDRRRRITDVRPVPSFTRDRHTVLLTTFTLWRVADPLLFVQALGGVESAEPVLAGLVTAARNEEVSLHDLSALVSSRPEENRFDDVERQIARRVEQTARDRLGIEVDRVAIERIELPPENVRAVLERMRAERATEAARLRAEGAKAAQAIRDDAHVKSQELLRDSREQASRIKAQAERDAALILAEAHEQAPDFYRVWSSLETAKQALGKNAIVVLRTDHVLFAPLLDAGKANVRPASGVTRSAPQAASEIKEER
ncbi:MAG TPA: protease modulator HflC [Pirellulaceae bacterium]|nr:protease modulator HflC [Pirellulaceae bacterium]